MSRKLLGFALVAVVALAVVAGFAVSKLRQGDQLIAVLPNAIGIVEGTPVQLDGFDVGQVTGITTKNNKAILSLVVDKLPEPLRTGTTVTVEWRSLLGERYVQLRPGPTTNPVLPNGAMIEAGSSQVVVEDLLQALDPPTRAHLTSFVQQLNTVMAGHQGDFNQTLQAAGPSVQALGAVLNAVGSDGQAIKTVLANLHQVSAVLAERRGGLSSTVLDLNRLTSTAAVHQQQLSDGLTQLPATLDSAKKALDKVPAATDATVPLLHDLRPAADRLPDVAHNLSPVLRDLQPSLKLLGPTLDAADRLLDRTPDFLDEATDTLPQLRKTVEGAGPALAFLRPYTPEIMGFVSNWGNFFSTYDSVGHFASPMVVTGKTALDNNPNVTIPGERASTQMSPGQLVDQSWTDADGSGPR
ncbi:MAG: phospholipid/cholesterol/gamma-HCH transport system substrate-binding protein [Pseudonocardiales bacterium]|nr:phospholipid/cholesterol/gamma-HCH transport system substrate-binding protein [Pseudonocardiales bacterium]